MNNTHYRLLKLTYYTNKQLNHIIRVRNVAHDASRIRTYHTYIKYILYIQPKLKISTI